MEEFLTNINLIKKNNYINQLKHDNKRNEERLEKYVENFKKEITEQELEKRQNQKTIKQLTEQNEKLLNENKSYKFILDKIPNWVIRLFVGKKNIGGYLQ